MTERALELDSVTAGYGKTVVLHKVSLTVGAGERVAIVGRNGVGKTTLARSIMGLTPAKRGRILFKQIDITNFPAHRIARLGIGLVPQGRQIFRSLSVKEHLEVTARGQGGWSSNRIMELFPNLRARLRSLAGKLSGGEQQMLAAARALVGNPAMLVMDEPTEGLAPLMIRELGRTIETLKQSGTSILLIEQQLAFALRYADAVFIMSKGRIVHQCSPADLALDAQTKSRYLGV